MCIQPGHINGSRRALRLRDNRCTARRGPDSRHDPSLIPLGDQQAAAGAGSPRRRFLTGRLAGKVALVTGSAAGIGRATAERLSREGALVYAVDLVETPHDSDSTIQAITSDVTDPEAMEHVVSKVDGEQPIDICIANAGIYREYDGFLGTSASAWEETLRVNLLGVLITFQAVSRRMIAGGRGGRLLATASNAGLRGEPGSPAYCASKGALVLVVQSLAVELAPYGITTNGVAPGTVETELSAAVSRRRAHRTGRSYESIRKEIREGVPNGRIAEPEEIAALYCFLASDEASHINGETICIDGGEVLAPQRGAEAGMRPS